MHYSLDNDLAIVSNQTVIMNCGRTSVRRCAVCRWRSGTPQHLTMVGLPVTLVELIMSKGEVKILLTSVLLLLPPPPSHLMATTVQFVWTSTKMARWTLWPSFSTLSLHILSFLCLIYWVLTSDVVVAAKSALWPWFPSAVHWSLAKCQVHMSSLHTQHTRYV